MSRLSSGGLPPGELPPSGLPSGGLPLSGLPRDWLPTLVSFLDREPVVVRIVVAEVRGSTPREPGAFMLVGRDGIEGSIGGGQLEWEAIAAARELLADATVAARVNKVVLGPDVGQCCGGVVSVWLERFTRESLGLLRAASEAGARGCGALSSTIRGSEVERRVVRPEPSGAINTNASTSTSAGTNRSLSPVIRSPLLDEAADRLMREPRQRAHPILTRNAAGEATLIERLDDEFPAVWLYGAGHVGQALARILIELPLRLTWIDSRSELFPEAIGAGARILRGPDSLATVSEAPVGAFFIVMSHSHPLDYALCHALLERNDFAWLGLIGSMSKAARFRSRLARAGLGAEIIRKLVCPIGVDGIDSKWPAAIAVAVAAQLMQQTSAPGVGRPELHVERGEVPGIEAARVEGTRGEHEGADSTCAPENCATCGSTPARRGTVTS
jgi:xanthine dehydrogenase accessory factor